MPKVSVNILTHNRAELLKKALASVEAQSFADFEVIVIDDGSTDGTGEVLKNLKIENLKIITHKESIGITASRQEALLESAGEYVAVLDDDDEWIDSAKLAKQVKYLDEHPDAVLVGGGIIIERLKDLKTERFRPETDAQIRRTMLFKNNFFTSTVMFRREAALHAGGFAKDGADLAEDYDLWLRLGKFGKFHNFFEVFTAYRAPSYNTDKFKQFLRKQSDLIRKYRRDYPFYFLAAPIIKIRLLL